MGSTSGSTTMKMLLVEDEPRVAHFIARGLREQSFAVDIESDGEEALYQLSINDCSKQRGPRSRSAGDPECTAGFSQGRAAKEGWERQDLNG